MTLRLLAVHAHPDDESITMGGTLARYAAAGVEVTVVTATLGEEGEVIPRGLAGLAADRADQLGGYRYTELRAACAALGVRFELLGGIGAWRDSGMAGTAPNDHPRAFARAATGGPDHRRAVADLVEVIERQRPHVLLTYPADGGYGHPDHVAVHQVCMAAADGRVPRVLASVRPAGAVDAAASTLTVPSGLRRAVPEDLGYLCADDAVTVAVDVAYFAAARARALVAHRTQVVVFDAGFALSNGIAQPLLTTEYFALLAGHRLPDGADDVFAGLADEVPR